MDKHVSIVILLGFLLPVATLLYLAPVNALPACPVTLTTSTYNLPSCQGTINITASNINLGCKSGAKITPVPGNTNGIVISGQSHVNVFGCTITGFSANGIYISGGFDNSLTGNNASFNVIGFNVYRSYNDTLAGNIATSNNPTGNGAYGFIIEYSDSNNLASNKATSNFYGFYMIEAGFNVLSDNTATSNGIGFNFVSTGSNHNTVTDNTANINSQYGFYFDSTTSGNLVVGNAAKGNTILNADNIAGPANNFHTSLNPAIKPPYSGLQSP